MSPKAGAHGELCGILCIRAALEARGDARSVVLVPDSPSDHLDPQEPLPEDILQADYLAQPLRSQDMNTRSLAQLAEAARRRLAVVEGLERAHRPAVV